MPRSSVDAHQSRKLTRIERLQRCFDFFDQGLSNAEVCRRMKLAPNTATKWRRLWAERNRDDLVENQSLLQQVLSNTLQMLRENEQIRRAAWQEYHAGIEIHQAHCDECDALVEFTIGNPVTRNSSLNTLMKSQEHRAKLLGVLGIKQEFFGMVSAVQAVQEKLLEFLARELCPADRAKLDSYFDSPEMQPYMVQAQSIPVATLQALTQEAS